MGKNWKGQKKKKAIAVWGLDNTAYAGTWVSGHLDHGKEEEVDYRAKIFFKKYCGYLEGSVLPWREGNEPED